MGFFDRVKKGQDEHRKRMERQSEAGDDIVNAIGNVNHAFHVLRGNCPRCGTTNAVETNQAAARVRCVSCETEITLSS
jgi:ribosomal protein S27E